ncbi:bifunctional hydroxymethylpyrimidine kinase/phosphomethylpyrimidine kinase, partial [Microbacteriaceae bacterium K1510]|nr:bifunctional hydroxymethylpyrimidine kinase/phosphomethylpyrimidine kinase [Microbacteriaceae bacterium K1510]
PTPEIIKLVAKKLEQYKPQNLVVDPVLVCKGGGEVLQPETAEALRDVLVPMATVVTPNLFEAAALSGLPQIKTVEEMK